MSRLATALHGGHDLAGESTATAGRPCIIHSLVAGLDGEDRGAVHAAVTDPHPTRRGRYRIGHDDLAARLTRAGHPVSAQTIARHRRGYCGCSGAGQ